MNLPTLPRTERTHKSNFWPSVIKYRAFTAGQQTLLLQVADPETPMEERNATMQQLFDSCVDAGVPFGRLPIGVVEEVFIRMRCISIGEIMNIRYKCNHKITVSDVDDNEEIVGEHEEECGQEITLPIPLMNVGCSAQEGFTDVFDLPGGYHIKMRQPSFSDAAYLSSMTSVEEMIAVFIDCLYDDDGQVWKIEDPNEPGIHPDVAKARLDVKNSFSKWVGENIEADIIEDISTNFFKKIPRIHYNAKMTCPKCKHPHAIEFNSIQEIFI